ncbi:lipoprotein N-acyltransferase Lnb domain-containing protein [Viscerimonas tarda]
MIRKILISFIIGLTGITGMQAQSILLSDSAQISLLTNSPWYGASYTVFGHTAIRVNDKAYALDCVFNYGIFDFNKPNFTFRFMKGETDYMVAGYPFEYYLEEYKTRGVASYEQRLNLTQQEKQAIWDALYVNALPANREYRYNFFFDNCATRPRDIIEKNINGHIKYAAEDELLVRKRQTFRDLVHECTSPDPWLRFSIDLLIGTGADREATVREKMFLPLYLKQACDHAVIVSEDGTERKLVAKEVLITEAGETNENGAKPTNYPFIAGIVLLLITFAVSVLSFRNRCLPGKVFDVVLFAVMGLLGCIIAFLVFFSEHPATSPNWNLVWLNPLQLIIAILIPVKYFSKAVYYYHFINFVCLSLFLLFRWLIPQHFEASFSPFVFALYLRSGTNFVQSKLNKKSLTFKK